MKDLMASVRQGALDYSHEKYAGYLYKLLLLLALPSERSKVTTRRVRETGLKDCEILILYFMHSSTANVRLLALLCILYLSVDNGHVDIIGQDQDFQGKLLDEIANSNNKFMKIPA